MAADVSSTPRRTRTGWLLAAAASGALTWWLADVWDAQRLAHLAVWVVLGLVVLPLSFAAALAAVGAVLLGVLGVLSVPAWLSGRPVGLGGVARDLRGLAFGIVPDYLRALRAVQKPWLWGAAAGFVLGVAARLMFVGLTAA